MRRRLIAIGDLHGDVHRLVRILERQEVFLSGTRKWARAANTVDVVLLGDYVDWRGEPLEGDKATWEKGSAALLDLIVDLHKQVDEMAAASKASMPRFVSIMGNHDKLMLDAYKHLAELPKPKRDAIAACHTDLRKLQKEINPTTFFGLFGKRNGNTKMAERLFTWMANGGPSTIKSFGGFEAWYARMEGGLAKFIERKMPLGVVINRRLYSHSVPDESKWWRPVDAVMDLRGDERDEAVEEWVWGRRIYGFDHKTGKKIDKPPAAEVDKMLNAMKVNGVVVGHSLMQSLVPVRAYEGKVVNIDLHGHPLSEPWLEQYEE